MQRCITFEALLASLEFAACYSPCLQKRTVTHLIKVRIFSALHVLHFQNAVLNRTIIAPDGRVRLEVMNVYVSGLQINVRRIMLLVENSKANSTLDILVSSTRVLILS